MKVRSSVQVVRFMHCLELPLRLHECRVHFGLGRLPCSFLIPFLAYVRFGAGVALRNSVRFIDLRRKFFAILKKVCTVICEEKTSFPLLFDRYLSCHPGYRCQQISHICACGDDGICYPAGSSSSIMGDHDRIYRFGVRPSKFELSVQTNSGDISHPSRNDDWSEETCHKRRATFVPIQKTCHRCHALSRIPVLHGSTAKNIRGPKEEKKAAMVLYFRFGEGRLQSDVWRPLDL